MKNDACKPKKVLIIVNALNIGGAENMIYELVKSINKEEYLPVVVCYGQKIQNSLEQKMEKICDVKYVGLTGEINLNSMKKVFSVIKEINPDIIHAHQGGVTFAIPWCVLNRVPLCITVHSKPEQAFSPVNNRMIRIFKNIINLKVIAVSKENLMFVRDFYKIGKNKSDFINNGIDIDRFYKLKHDNFTFINVARQDENKNQILIIRAMEKLVRNGKNVNLLLIGEGPCHNYLKSEVYRLGLSESISFIGQIADPEKYYAVSDVYVQTSFREALPLSVLEAMATGLPIIATNVGGLKDIVDENGILLAAGDEQALYSAMIYMSNVSDLEYTRMSNNSKKRVEDYTSIQMAEKYGNVYGKLLNE